MLRALWDSDVEATELTAGGLNAEGILDALYEFEKELQADDFQAIATAFAFGVDDDNADGAWGDDLQVALNAFFCNDSGALNTVDETVALADAFAEVVGDFYQEDFDAFIVDSGLDISANTEDLAAALDSAAVDDYLWLDSICPGATIDGWAALFTGLSDAAFDKEPICSEKDSAGEPLLVNLVDGDAAYVVGDTVANTACPPCRAVDAEALTEEDENYALYNGFERSSTTGSLHFCIETTDDDDAGTGGDGDGDDSNTLDPTVMPDCDED